MERLQRNGEVFLVPIDQIVVDEAKNNKRTDYGDIEELAQSIASESGLKTPILLKKIRGEEKYELIHGHRRMRAIQLLISKGVEFPRVRAFLAPVNYTQDDVLLDMIIMNDGKPFNNYEQGLVFVQLKGRGFTETEISKRVGKSTTHIHNCIEMASLPKVIQNEIAAGNISGGTAVSIFKNAENEEEAVLFVQNTILKAKEESGGKQKKATSRHAENAALSPIKTLERVAELLEEHKINNSKVSLFKALLSRSRAKVKPEDFIELFK